MNTRPSSTRYSWTPVAVLAAILIAGCSPKKPEVEPEKPPVEDKVHTELKSEQGATKILSKAEVEEFYGVPFKDAVILTGEGGEKAREHGISTANYEGVEDPGTMVAIYLNPIEAVVSNAVDAVDAYNKLQDQLSMQGGLQVDMSLVPVEGLGEKAGWLAMMEQLYVFKGDYFFVLMCSGTTNKSSMQASQDLARFALKRIPGE